MTRYQETALGIVACIVFALFFLFILLNWVMGCETWDQSYWTATNSCVTPTEFIKMFLPN